MSFFKFNTRTVSQDNSNTEVKLNVHQDKNYQGSESGATLMISVLIATIKWFT